MLERLAMSAKRNLIIVIGVPGAGKTTVINGAIEKIKNDYHNDVVLLNFGTEMLNLAIQEKLVENRDQIRKLPTSVQRELQKRAAEEIAKKSIGSIVIVDTHALIRTNNGYLIGLPEWVVKPLSPKTIVCVEAMPEQIAMRRVTDEARIRDGEAAASIDEHQLLNRVAAISVGTLTGATVRIIKNYDNQLESAINELVSTLME